jgi:hypothetical protein
MTPIAPDSSQLFALFDALVELDGPARRVRLETLHAEDPALADALGLALWPDVALRDEARGLLDEGIAGMERKSMGFHPLVARAKATLAGAP